MSDGTIEKARADQGPTSASKQIAAAPFSAPHMGVLLDGMQLSTP
jgi:hypothetical protein